MRAVAQMVVMAIIVATALFVPVGALCALAAFLVFRVSLHGFLTFGGSLTALQGVMAWWAIFLAPALVYAAYVMPWRE